MNTASHNPKLPVLLAAFFLYSITISAQNVGINTTNPTERLDVNGNINVTGTIKANGTDGNANQVLMKNGSGNLVWGDLCEYKNAVTLFNASGTWNVPAGVTRIFIEVWGGGGGGNSYGGGGGGTYIAAPFTVTPGLTITYTVGSGGAQGSNTNATAGSSSTAQVGSPSISITAQGGGGATWSNMATGGAGSIGGFSTVGVTDYLFDLGRAGESTERSYMQFNATTYYETGRAGKGGDAGNNRTTGATGSFYVYNTTAGSVVYRSLKIADGLNPGGGGASGIQYGATSISGGNGGGGLIVIRW